jgi:hypothetical protein
MELKREAMNVASLCCCCQKGYAKLFCCDSDNNRSAKISPLQGLLVLYCTVLCYTVLCYIAQHCTVLHFTALHYTALHCTVLYCIVLHCTVLHCTVLVSNYTAP